MGSVAAPTCSLMRRILILDNRTTLVVTLLSLLNADELGYNVWVRKVSVRETFLYLTYL